MLDSNTENSGSRCVGSSNVDGGGEGGSDDGIKGWSPYGRGHRRVLLLGWHCRPCLYPSPTQSLSTVCASSLILSMFLYLAIATVLRPPPQPLPLARCAPRHPSQPSPRPTPAVCQSSPYVTRHYPRAPSPAAILL